MTVADAVAPHQQLPLAAAALLPVQQLLPQSQVLLLLGPHQVFQRRHHLMMARLHFRLLTAGFQTDWQAQSPAAAVEVATLVPCLLRDNAFDQQSAD